MQRKTLNSKALQQMPSARELAQQHRMAMKRAIARLKQESNSFPVMDKTKTWSIPKPPPGVVPESVLMAMDEAPDGYSGWAMQNALFAEGQAFLGYPYLAELSQRPEYRIISETWAQEMTRKWVRLVSTGSSDIEDKEDKLKEIEAEMKRLKVQDCFRKCTELDGLFGRAQIYIDLGVDSKDRDELKSPIGDGAATSRLSKAKVKKNSLKSLRVIEPVWTYPNSYNANDPLKADFFKPSTWFVMGQEIHTTRLLTFIGRPMPDLLKPAYSFGGLSLSQMTKPYIDNWLRTRQSVSDAISNYSIMVLLTDMAALMDEGAATDLVDRAEFFNVTRDNRGLMLADKNSEELTNVSMPLSGLDHLQAQSQEHMSSPSQIPLVKLTGISPSGLNATSEYEVSVFYNKVEAQQVAYFTENLSKILNFIQLSLYGVVDPEIGFVFEPLEAMDPAEIATQRKTEGDTDIAYINAGVISPLEARTRLASDEESPYAALDLSEEALPEPPQQPGQETDENGNPMDHQDAEGGTDKPDAPAATGGAVPQGNQAAEKGNKPVQSKPVAGAHDSAEFVEEEHPRDDGGKFTQKERGDAIKNYTGTPTVAKSGSGKTYYAQYGNEEAFFIKPVKQGDGSYKTSLVIKGLQQTFDYEPLYKGDISFTENEINTFNKADDVERAKMVLKKSLDIPEASTEEKQQRETWRQADKQKREESQKQLESTQNNVYGSMLPEGMQQYLHKNLLEKLKSSVDFEISSNGAKSPREVFRSEDVNKAGQAAVLEAISREAVKRGAKFDYVSSKSRRTGGSQYLKMPNGLLWRISDHELPETPARNFNRSEGLTGRWDRELILDDWRSKPMSEYMDELFGNSDQAHDIAMDFNPNHNKEDGEFAKGTGEASGRKNLASTSSGLPVDASGNVELTHYSRTPNITALNPHMYGSGLRGAESARMQSDPHNWVSRSFHYVGPHRKEAGLGRIKYTSKLPASKLYDLAHDPDHIKKNLDYGNANEQNAINVYEKAIKDAGYEGYWVNNPQFGGIVAATFNALPVTQAQDAEFNESDHPRGQPDNAGQFTSSAGSSKIHEAATHFASLPQDVIDNYDWDDIHKAGGRAGYELHEARKLAPKSADKLKRVNDSNTFSLHDSQEYVANIDGVHFGITKQEDPDEPDDESKFVYAYQRLDDPDTKLIGTTTDDKEELFKELHKAVAASKPVEAAPERNVLKLSGKKVDPVQRDKQLKPFFSDFLKAGFRNPLDDTEVIIGKAGVELKPTSEGNVHISFIRSLEQGHGHASKALDTVCELADKHGVTLDLEAAPMPHYVENQDTAMSKSQLLRWYSRHGFVEQKQRGNHDHMVRLPKGKAVGDAWNEADHPRGQPENKGEFAKASGGSAQTTAIKYPEHKSPDGKSGKIVSHGTESKYSGLHTAYVGGKPLGDFRSLAEAKTKMDSHFGGANTEQHFSTTPKKTLPDNSPLLVESRSDHSKEAQSERVSIALHAFANAKPVTGRKPVLYVMGGGSGAGKGYLLHMLQEEGKVPTRNDGAVMIDPDGIKTSMKRYKQVFAAGDYRASAIVHEDSSALSKDILKAAKEGHYDIVFDVTMSDHDKGIKRIQEFKDAGYTVKMFNVVVDPKLALKRAMMRYENTGRYVDPAMLNLAHKNFGAALPDYEKLVDEFETYSNNDKMKLERSSKDRLAGDDWNESQHPRGQPENAGEFAKGTGGSKPKLQKRPVTASTKRTVLFEVAPDPHSERIEKGINGGVTRVHSDLSARWNKVDPQTRTKISIEVLNDVLPEVLKKTGAEGKVHMQYGGYGADTNPSVSLVLGKGTSDEQADLLTRSLGAILSQDSMMRVAKKPFTGSTEMGAVIVKVPKNIGYKDVQSMYNTLRASVLDVRGNPLINGHTTDAGRMIILVDKDTEENLATRVNKALNDKFEVGHDTLNVSWPEKGDDNYGFSRQDKSGRGLPNTSVRDWINSVRAETTGKLQRHLKQYEREQAGNR